MSVTRKQLRHSIGIRTQQPFFRSLKVDGTDLTSDGGATSTTLLDASHLTHADDYWNGEYLYIPSTEEVRQISDFTQGNGTLTFLEPMAAAPSAVTYELWSQFTPYEIHAAINQALRDAWPFFFENNMGTVVFQANAGTSYRLSTNLQVYTTGVLDTLMPRVVTGVELEDIATSVTGTATAGGASTLTDTNKNFTNLGVTTAWEIRIYDGTGKGQRRTIDTVAATVITVSDAWGTQPDTTSKYTLVDVSDETHGWQFITQWSVDRPDNPQYLRIGAHSYGYEGYLMRVHYAREFQSLTAEADATTCPQEYVELAALARLYLIKMTNISATEVKNWEGAQTAFAEAAAQYAQKNRYFHNWSTYADDQELMSRVQPEYPF
jgi:hypothetical protein